MAFERAAGVLLHPTSLPGPWGIGDLGPAAHRYVEWLADAGVGWWQVLPHNPPGPGFSPYASISSFAGSALLVSPDALVPDGLLQRADLAARPPLSDTANKDGTVKMWDTATGKELLALTHTSPITKLAFSPDGEKITAGDTEGTIKVWDTTSGRELLTLTGHKLTIYAISFSADGKRIATGGMDQTAGIWDAASGMNLLILSGHTASVLAVAFSPDESLLATGSHDSTVRIWSLTNGKELLTLTGHDGWIDTVAFSPSGKLVGTGSRQAGIWVQEGRAYAKMRQADQAVAAFNKAIEAAPDNGDYRKALAQYYMSEKRYDDALNVYSDPRTTGSTPPDQALFALGKSLSNQGNAEVSELAFEKVLKLNPQHEEACYDLGMAF